MAIHPESIEPCDTIRPESSIRSVLVYHEGPSVAGGKQLVVDDELGREFAPYGQTSVEGGLLDVDFDRSGAGTP